MSTFQKTAREADMLSVEDAQSRVLAAVRPTGREDVPLAESLGRVLAEDIAAPRDIPSADNSAMDGYAVRASDLSAASEAQPVRLRVIEHLAAGGVARNTVHPGTAIRIMTGAPLPGGADAVVPVELTDAGDEEVQVLAAVTPGANIRRRGEDMRAGATVLSAGMVIGASEVGVLAGVQKQSVSVARRPRVAILSSGDELVDVDKPPGPGQVVNSNAYALAALVREEGAEPILCGVTGDTLEATTAAFERALAADFVLSSGGVSVGAYDFVKDALDALGARMIFWKVSMKPGKPVAVFTRGDRLVFALPGNPVSCMITFLLFASPALRRAMGRRDVRMPLVRARLEGRLKPSADRHSYLRVRVLVREGQLVAVPMTAQGSGVTTSMVGANGLAVLPPGAEAAVSPAEVSVLLFRSLSRADD